MKNDAEKELLELSFINPLQLFHEKLEEYYGHIAYFFSDFYGGDKIAIVWKESLLKDSKFKVGLNFNSMPSGTEARFALI